MTRFFPLALGAFLVFGGSFFYRLHYAARVPAPIYDETKCAVPTMRLIREGGHVPIYVFSNAHMAPVGEFLAVGWNRLAGDDGSNDSLARALGLTLIALLPTWRLYGPESYRYLVMSYPCWFILPILAFPKANIIGNSLRVGFLLFAANNIAAIIFFNYSVFR